MTTDPATSADPQAGDTDSNPQPQAGVPSTDPQAGESQTNDTISLEEAKKLRSEAANLRKRLKAFEDAENKAKDAQLSEQQRRDKQLADYQARESELTRQLQETRISTALEKQVRRIGVTDETAISDAVRLIDLSELEYDENGMPTNAEDVLKKLIKARPWLTGKAAAQTSTSGGATNPSRSTTTAPQELSWDVIGKMNAQDYAARAAEIQQWILNHPPGYGQRMR